MAALPHDPFRLVPPADFAPTARRELTLCGAPVELLWIPERASRRGAPNDARPSFPPSHVARILAEETVWSDGELALTGNRHPFDAHHLLLWSVPRRREPDAAMLTTAFRLAADCAATVLGNTIGAAASIARAHLHLLPGHAPFLPGLPTAAWEPPAGAELPAGIETFRAAAPFPALLVGLRGPLESRALAVARLLEMRSTTAYNLVDQDGTTWLFPRSVVETPAPHFPQALGSAEVWGRWCHLHREAFERATPDTLLAALALGGRPR